MRNSTTILSMLRLSRLDQNSTRFVRRGELTTVKQQLRNYEQLRKLVDRWITLGTELSNLKLDQQRKSRSQRASERRTSRS